MQNARTFFLILGLCEEYAKGRLIYLQNLSGLMRNSRLFLEFYNISTLTDGVLVLIIHLTAPWIQRRFYNVSYKQITRDPSHRHRVF